MSDPASTSPVLTVRLPRAGDAGTGCGPSLPTVDRWTALLLGVAVALWVDALAGGGVVAGPLALLAVAAAALLVGTRSRPATAAPAVGTTVVVLAVADQVAEAARFSLASDGVFYAAVVVVPAVLGRLLAVRRDELARLSRRRRELEDRRDLLVRFATADERAEVERRVDVALTGRLRTVADSIRAARGALDPGPALEQAELAARAALAELREVLGVLHEPAPPAPPPVAPGPPRTPAPRSVGRVGALLPLTVLPLAVETSASGGHGPVVVNVGLALAQGVALIVLVRRPVAGTALLVSLAVLQSAFFTPLSHTVGWLLPGLVASLLLGAVPGLRGALTGLVVLVAGCVLIVVVEPPGRHGSGGLLPGLAMGALTWLVARQVAARGQRVVELRAIADELDRTAGAASRLAAAEHRLALARELHDVGAHALTVVCLQAGAAQLWWDRDRAQARQALDTLVAVVDAELTELSASLGRVHAERGTLPELLDALCGQGRALGLVVAIDVRGCAADVADSVAGVAFRVVREALTNSARHAGATTVTVRLDVGAGRVRVQVHDSGPASAPCSGARPAPGSGRGLDGLTEIVRGAHGTFAAGPAGAGFRVSAELPT